MAEQQIIKVWSIPKLLVIARNRSEERVLVTCKYYEGAMDTNTVTACVAIVFIANPRPQFKLINCLELPKY